MLVLNIFQVRNYAFKLMRVFQGLRLIISSNLFQRDYYILHLPNYFTRLNRTLKEQRRLLYVNKTIVYTLVLVLSC